MTQIIPGLQGSATSDATGKVTILIQSYVAPGLAYKGNVAMTGGSATTLWNVSLTDGTSFGSSYGPAPIPCSITERTELQITATNAPPNTLIIAAFSGVYDEIYDLDLSDPNPTLTGISTTRPATLLQTVAVAAGTNPSVSVTVDPNARALTFLVERTFTGSNAALNGIQVTGNQSNFVYAIFVPAISGQRPALAHVEINPSIDQSFTIAIANPVPNTSTFLVFIAEDFDPMVIGIESFSDTANVIVENVQKTPTESRVTVASLGTVDIATSGEAGYQRGFEIYVPVASAVNASGVAVIIALNNTATASLGKELFPGGYYARADYNGRISAFNPSGSSNSYDVTLWQ